MAPASHGLLGRIQRANDDAAHRFGRHTAEVEAFIDAVALLTPWQWRQVLAARGRVASVAKDAGSAGGSARAIQEAIRSTDSHLSEPLARAGEILFDTLARRSEEKQLAAWEALSALVMRSQLPALKFAVHYAPFAQLIPLSGSDVLDPRTRRYLGALERLTPAQCAVLSRRWKVGPSSSRALLHAVAKNHDVKSEEAAAVVALNVIPHLATGDEGWAAVRMAAHGGRVLGCISDLAVDDVVELWSALEAAIPLHSLDEPEADSGGLVRAAITGAVKAIRQPRSARVTAAAAGTPAPYGPNTGEVAAFIKALAELTPIQWLRVLDRRKLVSSVTREDAEPAGVVRALLAALDATRELDMFVRCRVFAAVERAAYAAEAQGRIDGRHLEKMYEPFAEIAALATLNGGGFAHRVAALGRSDWERVAAIAPDANEEAVAPLVNAGAALTDFLGGRSDDEAVATWHGVAALVRRPQLTAIKFAASYAPFASAIPVTNPRSLGALVSRYVTAVGRLGASQCAALAEPWEVSDELSNALSGAVADGGARPAEEAAALAAVVTVPMRLAGPGGWAAVKTVAFGARVIACRARFSTEQLEALWRPLQAAIPLASLSASRTRR